MILASVIIGVGVSGSTPTTTTAQKALSA